MYFGLNDILLKNVMYNTHIHIFTYFCGTGSDRELKVYINHLLIYKSSPDIEIISGSCIFSLIFSFILQENIRSVYLLESPWRGDSNKYTKRIIYNRKTTVQKYPLLLL